MTINGAEKLIHGKMNELLDRSDRISGANNKYQQDVLDLINCQLVDYQDILTSLAVIKKATANIAVAQKYLDEITSTWEAS